MFLQGALASLFALLFRHARWWLPLHLLFPLAIGFSLTLPIPAWLYLLAFLLMLLAYWGTAVGEVPLFLSSRQVAEALADIVLAHQSPNFIDLGAGIGSVVVPLAQRLPSLQITAVENAPLPWLILRWRCRHLANAKVIRANFWNLDLGDFNTVYAFLSPAVMERLGTKCRLELKNGAWLISSSFAIPQLMQNKSIPVNDRRQSRLYCYHYPAKPHS